MILLPNGCKCSNPIVSPKNWKTPQASVKKPWRITYRFYDPTQPQPKLVKCMGMNRYGNLAERKSATQIILDAVNDMLISRGYNPFIKKYIEPVEINYEIDPDTTFILALKSALTKLTVTHHTKEDIEVVIKSVKKAASTLGLQTLKISEVKKKHIRLILDHLSRTNARWSANQFNHYRKYLSILFRELSELEAVDYNPIRDIAKQKTVARIRPQLTQEQRTAVDEFLRKNHYNFWRFMQIFFHSGARESELMRLKVSDVNLKDQEFKVTILKGRSQAERIKPIKNIALSLWEELLSGANPEDYVFSKLLRPGPVQINPHQIPRRWNTHVKKHKTLGITADFYSLKHSNLDETAAALSLNDAAAMANHSTPVITMTYATGESKRQRDRLKEVNNKF